MTLLAPARPTTWPRTTTCPRCQHPILTPHGAWQVPLNPIPVLPQGPCGECQGRGRKTFRSPLEGSANHVPTDTLGALEHHRTPRVDDCPVCAGTGVTGEPLSGVHVLVDRDGFARLFDGLRLPWEAAYRRHRCG